MQLPVAYITSERFIHDGLIKKTGEALETLTESYSANGRIEPFLFFWPAEKVHADNGVEVTDIILLELPKDKNSWATLIVRAMERTKAYALCLVRETPDGASALLESPHGTYLWVYRKKYRGGYYALELDSTRQNEEHLGLLWRPPDEN
jgi:hypothetical protein